MSVVSLYMNADGFIWKNPPLIVCRGVFGFEAHLVSFGLVWVRREGSSARKSSVTELEREREFRLNCSGKFVRENIRPGNSWSSFSSPDSGRGKQAENEVHNNVRCMNYSNDMQPCNSWMLCKMRDPLRYSSHRVSHRMASVLDHLDETQRSIKSFFRLELCGDFHWRFFTNCPMWHVVQCGTLVKGYNVHITFECMHIWPLDTRISDTK